MPDSSAPADPAGEHQGRPPGGPARRLLAGVPGLLLLLVLYLLVYVRTVGFGFVWDDPANFADSPLMRGPLADIIRKGEHARADPSIERLPKDMVPRHESYRPVSVVSHWLDVRYFDKRPGLMHLHSVLLGLLSVVLVYLIAKRLGVGLALPGLWALHPLHVEVFAYLSARSDLLAALAALVALLFAFRSLDARSRAGTWAWAVAASLLHGLSLFAKEGNLGLPFAFVALAVALGKTRQGLACAGSMLAVTAAYFPLRSLMMQAVSLPMAQSGPMLRSLLDAPGVGLAYAVSFVLPFSLSPDRQLWPPFVLLGWVALAGSLSGTILAWRRLPAAARPHLRLFALATLGLGPLLLPAALGFRSIGALSDRYAFFLLLFFGLAALALARLIAPAWHFVPRLARYGVLLVWAAIVLATTWLNVGVWRSDESLARHAVVTEPDNARALYRLATVATAQRRFAMALPLLERAAALDGQNPRVLNNLAVVYLELGRIADAKAVLRQLAPLARAIDKRYWYNVAAVQITDGKPDKACSALAQALAIDPAYAMALALRQRACTGAASPAPSTTPPANPGAGPRP